MPFARICGSAAVSSTSATRLTGTPAAENSASHASDGLPATSAASSAPMASRLANAASGVAMVAVGFQFGIVGSRRINTANIALAMTFALVLLVAFDLDRAGEGLIHVNQQPMIDLYQSMSKHQ